MESFARGQSGAGRRDSGERRPTRRAGRRVVVALLLGVVFTAGCESEPNYQRIDAAPPFRYDEAQRRAAPSCPPESLRADAVSGDAKPYPYRKPPGQTYAAGWNDLREWDYWQRLVDEGPAGDTPWSQHASAWSFDVRRRYSVAVTSGSRPVPGAMVELIADDGDGKVNLVHGDDEIVWRTRTGPNGRAELFHRPFQTEETDSQRDVAIRVQKNQASVLTTDVRRDSGPTEIELEGEFETDTTADVIFLFDATASMDDQQPGLRIDANAAVTEVEKRTDSPERIRWAGASFTGENEYRLKPFDLSTEYVVSIRETDRKGTIGYSNEYAEPVLFALDRTVNAVKWREDAVKIVVLVTDAPPPQSATVRDKMPKTIRKAAENGIHVLPVAASGIDASGEYLLRAISIATSGRFAATFVAPPALDGESRTPTLARVELECLDTLLAGHITDLAGL